MLRAIFFCTLVSMSGSYLTDNFGSGRVDFEYKNSLGENRYLKYYFFAFGGNRASRALGFKTLRARHGPYFHHNIGTRDFDSQFFRKTRR